MNRHLLPQLLLLCLASLSGALVPSPALAQQRLLRLDVWRIDRDGRRLPAAGASVSLLGHGNPTRVQSEGQAQLFLPSVLKPGAPLSLHVSLSGHQLFQPSQGQLVVPKYLETEVVEVVLLPLGSKLFLSDAAIERLIEDASRRAKEQVKLEGRPGSIDLSRYLQEWAVRYGFSYEEVAAQVNRWAVEVERQRDDGRKLGLAAFVRHDFRAAARHASDAAELKLRRLAQARRWRQSLEGAAVEDLRLEAEAHARRSDHERALAASMEALRYVSREAAPRTWAALMLQQGRASLELAVLAGDASAGAHLENAVRALEQTMEVPGSQAEESLQHARLLLREHRALHPLPGGWVVREPLWNGCIKQELDP
jgi:hypothetical protein